MAATRLIAIHHLKGRTLMECLKKRIEYSLNPVKTEEGEYTSFYKCDAETVVQEFALSKRQYEHITGKKHNRGVIAYMIRQSFKPGEITPEKANKVGYELAMRFTKGKHMFFVATHTDKKHIHNHIFCDSITLDCKSKFRDFFRSGRALQKLSDLICIENNLSVIERKQFTSQKQKTTKKKFSQNKLSLLIDVQEKLQEGKGGGYTRWAKVFNVKQMAQTILFLQDQEYETFDQLDEAANEAVKKFHRLAAELKTLEGQAADSKNLKMQIINYVKTKDVYTAYRQGGYSQKFLVEHKEEIQLHKDAKAAFDKLGVSRIPKVKDLNVEIADIYGRRRDVLEEYYQAKEQMRKLLVVRENVRKILDYQVEEEKKKHKDMTNRLH